MEILPWKQMRNEAGNIPLIKDFQSRQGSALAG